jgi:hypothetical protein
MAEKPIYEQLEKKVQELEENLLGVYKDHRNIVQKYENLIAHTGASIAILDENGTIPHMVS